MLVVGAVGCRYVIQKEVISIRKYTVHKMYDGRFCVSYRKEYNGGLANEYLPNRFKTKQEAEAFVEKLQKNEEKYRWEGDFH